MKNVTPLLMAAMIIVALFSTCKNEESDDVVEPKVQDTTWTESSVVRDTNIIYYHNDIEKLLITKCAVDGYENSKKEIGCHSTPFRKAGVVLDNFNAVILEVDDKLDPDDSDLYEVFSETGDKKMPQEGNITPEEQNMIRDWINQGANDNICNPCDDYEMGSFKNSVAIILYKNCSGCHNDASKRGNQSFFKAYPGSKDDIDTSAVKAASGLILEVIVGIDRGRMPKYIDPLFECEYDAIKLWVDNGMIIN